MITLLTRGVRVQPNDDLWDDQKATATAASGQRERERDRQRDRPDFFSSKDILPLSIFPSLSELGGRAKLTELKKRPLVMMVSSQKKKMKCI